MAELEARLDELETRVARVSTAVRAAAACALCVIVYRFLPFIAALGCVALLVFVNARRA